MSSSKLEPMAFLQDGTALYPLSDEERRLLEAHREIRDAEQGVLHLYSRELELGEDLTVSALVESHRRIRSMIVEDQAERRASITAAYEKAFAQALAEARQREVFSRERLLGMSVQELVGYLADES